MKNKTLLLYLLALCSINCSFNAMDVTECTQDDLDALENEYAEDIFETPQPKSKVQKLYDAIRAKDVQSIRYLLPDHLKLETEDPDGLWKDVLDCILFFDCKEKKMIHYITSYQHETTGNTFLHNATAQSEVTILRKLLEIAPERIDTPNKENMTPLHCAVENNNVTAVLLLIEKKANIKLLDTKQRSALALAHETKNELIINALTEYIRTLPVDKEPIAYQGRMIEDLQFNEKTIISPYNILPFIERERSHEILEPVQEELEETFFTAVQINAQDTIADLVKKDAKIINAIHPITNCTAVHIATHNNNSLLVECLVTLGADVNIKSLDSGFSPVYSAIKNNNTELANYLINKGAIVTLKTHDNFSYVHLAAYKNNIEILMTLYNKGAYSIINDQTVKGNTALHVAVLTKNKEAARKLIELGIDMTIINEAKQTALDIAAEQGDAQMIDIILYTQVIQSTIDNDFLSQQLLEAFITEDLPVLKLLLPYGKKINSNNTMCTFPLHYATLGKCIDILNYLLDQDFDINAQDTINQDTPLHIAVRDECEETVKALLKKNPNVLLPNKYQQTAPYLARKTGNEKIITLLTPYIEKQIMNEQMLHLTIKDIKKQ